MRRIKSASISIPSVTGQYTSVSCTLTLLNNSVRKSPQLTDGGYARRGSEDTRFLDFVGVVESVVTSGGTSDDGLFETNLRDERTLPFEGAGAVSTWRFELPADFGQFDYNTIADVILHLRSTARQAGSPLREEDEVGTVAVAVFQSRDRCRTETVRKFPHDSSRYSAHCA